MEKQIFRKKTMDRLSSPEQLNDYLRVTSPAVWAVLCAIILLLAGSLIWAVATSIDSRVSGTALVSDGVMSVTVEDSRFAENVTPGQIVAIGTTESVITGVGKNSDGRVIATARTELPDGEYEAAVTYNRTQIIRLMFN